MSVVQLGAGGHSRVQALLPWYASGRLDGDDLTQVEAHLAACAGCRAELDIERKLQAAYPASDAAGDVEHGLALLRQRIDASPPRRHGSRASPRWLRWALSAQFAVIVLLAVLWRPQGQPADRYRGLGAPGTPGAANAVVMFRPDATEQQIRAALRAGDARVVGGPTATNAYLLRVPSAGHAAALVRLRAAPAVALAESLDAGAPP